MKTIIAGSREGANIGHVYAAVKESGITPTIVISGTARGVDRLGEQWARENGVDIERYPANWDNHGKSAGYLRNSEMAETLIPLLRCGMVPARELNI